ncbi:hypothetical protein Ancab_002223, partial [Ancistrocladus abbreviatus]
RRWMKYDFVRYLEMGNASDLLQQLRQVWVGSFKLLIDIARRKDIPSGKSKVHSPACPIQSAGTPLGPRLFKEVVIGKSKERTLQIPIH